MATIRIKQSRRVDLTHSEFDVEVLTGEPLIYEVLEYRDEQAAWEFVILEVIALDGLRRLRCENWLLADGFLQGKTLDTRALRAKERKRYDRILAGPAPNSRRG